MLSTRERPEEEGEEVSDVAREGLEGRKTSSKVLFPPRLVVVGLTRDASTFIDPPADCSEYILEKSKKPRRRKGVSEKGRGGRKVNVARHQRFSSFSAS